MYHALTYCNQVGSVYKEAFLTKGKLMEPKSEQSTEFQKFMASLLLAGGQAKITGTPMESTPEQKSLADQLADLRINFVSLQLDDLRVAFVNSLTEICEFNSARTLAYKAYAKVRDTKEAQEFIRLYPNFLPSIDHALFRCAVSVREANYSPVK